MDSPKGSKPEHSRTNTPTQEDLPDGLVTGGSIESVRSQQPRGRGNGR